MSHMLGKILSIEVILDKEICQMRERLFNVLVILIYKVTSLFLTTTTAWTQAYWFPTNID